MYENNSTSEKSYTANAISDTLEKIEFPISKQDLMQKYGDREIKAPNGKHLKLKELICDIPDETFNSADNIKNAYENKFTEGSM